VDQFLRHYLVAKQEESIQSKKIYRKIESMVEVDSASSRSVARALLTEIARKSIIYSQLLKPETIEDSFISENCRMLHPLLDTYRIFMLTILDEATDLTLVQRRELSNICEILCVRWVLTGGNAQELEDHFQDVSMVIQDSDRSYDDARELLLSKMPPDSKVKTQFSLDTTKTALVRSVLYRINKVIGDTSEMIILDARRMHVEHIAPVSMTDAWREALFPGKTDDVSAEYSARVEQWGNKTLLNRKINESIGTKTFREKCDGVETGNWGGYRDTPWMPVTRTCHFLFA